MKKLSDSEKRSAAPAEEPSEIQPPCPVSARRRARAAGLLATDDRSRVPSGKQQAPSDTLRVPGERGQVPAQLQRLAFSLAETAEILGISYISAYRLLQRGLLKSSSALRTKVVPLTEIQRFLKTTTT